MNEELPEELNIQFEDLNQEELKLPEALEESKAFQICTFIMEEFQPAFVIVGSPLLKISQNGKVFPDDVGIIMNDHINITRTVMSDILLELSTQLGADLLKIEQFLKEATGNNDNR